MALQVGTIFEQFKFLSTYPDMLRDINGKGYIYIHENGIFYIQNNEIAYEDIYNALCQYKFKGSLQN